MAAKKAGLSVSSPGRGYPVFNPERQVPTLDTEPRTLPDGRIQFPPSQLGGYAGKRVFRVVVDLTNTFSLVEYLIQGTLIFFSGQNGGTAAPMEVTLDNIQNDPIQITYDRAFSGIPFQKFYLTNLTAQPGVTAEFTIVRDSPQDRVGISN